MRSNDFIRNCDLFINAHKGDETAGKPAMLPECCLFESGQARLLFPSVVARKSGCCVLFVAKRAFSLLKSF